MSRYRSAVVQPPLEEMLGTFLQVSSTEAPLSYSLKDVATAFGRWAEHQPVERLANVYDHLLEGELTPGWEELGMSSILSYK